MEFATPEKLLDAVRYVRRAGFSHVEAYAPFAVENLPRELGLRGTRLPWLAAGGGVTGLLFGFGMQYYLNVIDYPLNVGGRPLNSVPAFIIVSLEVALLLAALATVAGFFWMNRLPMPVHPLFRLEEFKRASQDRFFLCIRPGGMVDNLALAERVSHHLQPLQMWRIEES